MGLRKTSTPVLNKRVTRTSTQSQRLVSESAPGTSARTPSTAPTSTKSRNEGSSHRNLKPLPKSKKRVKAISPRPTTAERNAISGDFGNARRTSKRKLANTSHVPSRKEQKLNIVQELDVEVQGSRESQERNDAVLCKSGRARRDPTTLGGDTLEVDENRMDALADQMNALKYRVAELDGTLNRTRETLMSTIDLQIKKIKEMEKELAQKNAMIYSLQHSSAAKECSCSRTSGSTKKKNVNDLDELFRPIAIAVLDVLRDEANDIVREVVSKNDAIVRDWNGKLEFLEDCSSVGNPMMLLDGDGAVPKCPLSLAMQGEVYTRPGPKSSILMDIVESVVDGYPQDMFNDDERKMCIAKVASHKRLVSWFNQVLSEEASHMKATFKTTFFEELGYGYIKKAARDRGETEIVKKFRLAEQKKAVDTFFGLHDNIPIFHKWITANLADIAFRDAEFTDGTLPPDDLFFKNDAAKKAFLKFRNHEHENKPTGDSDASIISLARADAWMATCLEMYKDELQAENTGVELERQHKLGSRGGKRNNKYKSLFKSYLPPALEAILSCCRKELLRYHKEEILRRTSVGSSQTYMPGVATVCFKMPSTNIDYMAVRPSYFYEHISKLMGKVRDCYIGRRNGSDSYLSALIARDPGNMEDSDVDDVAEDETVDTEEVNLFEDDDVRDDDGDEYYSSPSSSLTSSSQYQCILVYVVSNHIN